MSFSAVTAGCFFSVFPVVGWCYCIPVVCLLSILVILSQLTTGTAHTDRKFDPLCSVYAPTIAWTGFWIGLFEQWSSRKRFLSWSIDERRVFNGSCDGFGRYTNVFCSIPMHYRLFSVVPQSSHTLVTFVIRCGPTFIARVPKNARWYDLVVVGVARYVMDNPVWGWTREQLSRIGWLADV